MDSSSEIGLTAISESHVPTDSSDPSLHSRTSFAEPQDREVVSLPPVDGGTKAWLFLLGSFMIEALIWGFPFSFGVFQEYYESHEPFSQAPSGITVIGSSAMGIMYLGAPLVSYLLQRFPLYRRHFQIVGFCLMMVALISSSFATKVWHLILTQGVLYAIAGVVVYFPTIVWLDEWFVRRKGLAFGIMWAGTGVSGIVIPLVMNWGLEKYGYATMLRAWAVTMMLFAGPLLSFIRPRVPIRGTAGNAPAPRPVYYGFLRSPVFWGMQVGNIFEGLGFFIPNIYLPTYCRALGLSSINGAITVALFNTMSVFGAVLMGSLTDRFHVTTVILVSTIGATVSVFLFWGLASSLPLLCVFSLVYGLFAGGYSSTWTGVTREIRRKEEQAELAIIVGMLAAGRGVGSVVSGPLSELLVSRKPWRGDAALGYGTGYGGLIVFTGVSALLGGSSWAFRRAGLL